MIRIAVVFVVLLTSCRPEIVKQNPFQWQKKDEGYFSRIVNEVQQPDKIDSTESIKIVNHNYPIELYLYGDKTFRYKLENLGDGEGTWRYAHGGLKLHAVRKLFVMNIGIHSISEHDDEFAIDFVDRFGTQYLRVDVEKP